MTISSDVFVPINKPIAPGGKTEWEERYHAYQFEREGGDFLARYFLRIFSDGYPDDKFESEAKEFASLQVQTPPDHELGVLPLGGQ